MLMLLLVATQLSRTHFPAAVGHRHTVEPTDEQKVAPNSLKRRRKRVDMIPEKITYSPKLEKKVFQYHGASTAVPSPIDCDGHDVVSKKVHEVFISQ